MRTTLALGALALTLAAPALVQAQPYGAPRGSYQRQCTDIRVNGQFLSATCRGARGGGPSSINIQSCAGDIGVDASGALSCAGPGAAAPVQSVPPGPYPARPGYVPAPGQGYQPAPGADRYGDRDRDRDRYDRRRERFGLTLYARPGFRGPSVRVEGPTANLANIGLNDRVRSIELDRRSGPWTVCADAGWRGRCITLDRSVSNTAEIGLRDAISSLRPAY